MYFQAPTYHLIFEALLIILIVKLVFSKAYAPDKTILTEKVINTTVQIMAFSVCVFENFWLLILKVLFKDFEVLKLKDTIHEVFRSEVKMNSRIGYNQF